MITSDELELEYQLLKRNNPDWSEEKLRQEMFKRAMRNAVMEFCDMIDARHDDGRFYCGGIR